MSFNTFQASIVAERTVENFLRNVIRERSVICILGGDRRGTEHFVKRTDWRGTDWRGGRTEHFVRDDRRGTEHFVK
jgi:hypothetical protein